MYFTSTNDLIALLAVWAIVFFLFFISVLSLAGYDIENPAANAERFMESVRMARAVTGG